VLLAVHAPRENTESAAQEQVLESAQAVMAGPHMASITALRARAMTPEVYALARIALLGNTMPTALETVQDPARTVMAAKTALTESDAREQLQEIVFRALLAMMDNTAHLQTPAIAQPAQAMQHLATTASAASELILELRRPASAMWGLTKMELAAKLSGQVAPNAQVITNLAITASAAMEPVRELRAHAQVAPVACSFRAAVDSAMALVRTAPATTHLEVTPWDALELPMELARRAQAQVAPLACTRARCVARQAI